MTIEILDDLAFFAEQEEHVGALYICLPKEGMLFLNGKAQADGKKRTFHLYPTDLREGENTLSLFIDEKNIPCQGLFRHHHQITPCHFPRDELLLTLLGRQKACQRRLKELEEGLLALQKDMHGVRLF